MFEFEKEFVALLKEFQQQGALSHLVLIGSWCLPIYWEHFSFSRFTFTTSDVDFSISQPRDPAQSSQAGHMGPAQDRHFANKKRQGRQP
jgi:hypothetical protein